MVFPFVFQILSEVLDWKCLNTLDFYMPLTFCLVHISSNTVSHEHITMYCSSIVQMYIVNCTYNVTSSIPTEGTTGSNLSMVVSLVNITCLYCKQ